MAGLLGQPSDTFNSDKDGITVLHLRFNDYYTRVIEIESSLHAISGEVEKEMGTAKTSLGSTQALTFSSGASTLVTVFSIVSCGNNWARTATLAVQGLTTAASGFGWKVSADQIAKLSKFDLEVKAALQEAKKLYVHFHKVRDLAAEKVVEYKRLQSIVKSKEVAEKDVAVAEKNLAMVEIERLKALLAAKEVKVG